MQDGVFAMHLNRYIPVIRLALNFTRWNMWQVSVNGYLTLGYTTTSNLPYVFPYTQARIAAFFADVDYVCGGTRIAGDLWFRQTNGKKTTNYWLFNLWCDVRTSEMFVEFHV